MSDSFTFAADMFAVNLLLWLLVKKFVKDLTIHEELALFSYVQTL